jgi:hypothetical protein
VERLAQDLSTAVKSAWSKNRGDRYSRVNVLLTGWKDDDLNVDTEIEDLGFLFKDQYGYNVQKYQIPSLKPDRALKDRVLSFLKEGDKKDSLLIFYYAGHARRSPQLNGAPIWVASVNTININVKLLTFCSEIASLPRQHCLPVVFSLS